MTREPSIHITRKNLIKILKGMQIDDAKLLADTLMKRASKYNLSNRAVIVSNEKIKRDVGNIIKSSKGDILMMNQLIYQYRKIKLKQKGAQLIKIKDPQYNSIKNLCAEAIKFGNEFNLKKRKAFITYLEITLPKISSPRNIISKMVNMSEKVFNIYESKLIIQADKNSELTKKIHDYYVNKISTNTGIYQSLDDDPILYKNFVGASLLVKRFKIDYKDFIESQFKGLSFSESYPTPNQLITENAITRLSKFLYKNKQKVNKIKDNKEAIDILRKIRESDNN